jgi:hypothetical protein
VNETRLPASRSNPETTPAQAFFLAQERRCAANPEGAVMTVDTGIVVVCFVSFGVMACAIYNSMT